ncbi:hypothetical protein ACWD3J_24405 [Streptomyces sp. NPDC002755]
MTSAVTCSAARTMSSAVTCSGSPDASVRPYADLAGAGLRVGAFLDDQGLTERSYDRCLHGSPLLAASSPPPRRLLAGERE